METAKVVVRVPHLIGGGLIHATASGGLLVVQALQAKRNRPLLDLPRLGTPMLHLVLGLLEGLPLELHQFRWHGVHSGVN